MAVIGFSFSRFDCERKSAVVVSKPIEIKHNVNIDSVEKTIVDLGTNKVEVLKIFFSFTVNYSESLGQMKILGDAVYSDTHEIINETFKQWESSKKLSSFVEKEVLTFIYNKSSIKALILSESLNLPSPIPLPGINFNGKSKKK